MTVKSEQMQYDANRRDDGSKKVIGTLIFWGILIFGALYVGKLAWDHWTPQQVASVIKAEAPNITKAVDGLTTSASKFHKTCFNDECTMVPECTIVGGRVALMEKQDVCMSMVPANQGGYGLGDSTQKVPAVEEINPPGQQGYWLATLNHLVAKKSCLYNDMVGTEQKCAPMTGEWLTYLGARHYVSTQLAQALSDQ